MFKNFQFYLIDRFSFLDTDIYKVLGQPIPLGILSLVFIIIITRDTTLHSGSKYSKKFILLLSLDQCSDCSTPALFTLDGLL